MYATTNLKQYGRFLKDIRPMAPPFTCGETYRLGNLYWTPPPPSDFPFHFFFDVANNTKVSASVWPFSCTIDSLTTYNQIPNAPYYSATTYPYQNNNMKFIDLYILLQSTVQQFIPVPYTSSVLSSISPKDVANSTRNIPTFLMHGKVDLLVPYNQSTDSMKIKLNSLGGIDSLPNTTNQLPVTYPTSFKHYMKMYDNANHGMEGADLIQVRKDIVRWFYGHK